MESNAKHTVTQFDLFTLHYYSPRAYKYLRNKFQNHLPDVSCIRSWLSNTTGYGEPGISDEGLRALGTIANDMKAKKKEFYCSMSFDEMNIRRHVQWSDAKKKFVGFISYGKKDIDGQIPVARQALVFLITGINVQVSIPVGYFFIKQLTGSEKSALIKEILSRLTEVGVKVINITFDGLASNFTACRLLGAKFANDNLQPIFKNPYDQTKVHIILDACHMLKLIRNRIGTEKTLLDDEGGKIEWRFFVNLEKYRIERNFVTHKLTKKHIEWEKNKMCVRLAAQLFSNSVANSLSYLSRQNCHGFENCEATIKFIRIFNSLFDIFNSTMKESSNIFKNVISPESAVPIFHFLGEAIEYLKSIKLGDRYIINTDKRTGFEGFIINIISLRSIYSTYIETGLIVSIPTYQLSQDSLESLFGRIRSLCGSNDNPTSIQFTSGLRKILIKSEVTASAFANCTDNLQILTVSSKSNCV